MLDSGNVPTEAVDDEVTVLVCRRVQACDVGPEYLERGNVLNVQEVVLSRNRPRFCGHENERFQALKWSDHFYHLFWVDCVGSSQNHNFFQVKALAEIIKVE